MGGNSEWDVELGSCIDIILWSIVVAEIEEVRCSHTDVIGILEDVEIYVRFMASMFGSI